MGEVDKFQKAVDKALKKRQKSPLVLRRDEASIRYARVNRIDYVYVDVETGEIMQFGYLRDRGRHDGQWSGMFPHRQMQAMKLDDYDEMTKDKEIIC